MKMKTLVLAATMLTVALSPFAVAEEKPRNGFLDPRIKLIEYRDSQVFSVVANEFQDTLIVFAPEESITHIAAGDPMAWQIKSVGNYLSIKPILESANTNLNILTQNSSNQRVRSYSFELIGGKAHSVHDAAGTWQLRFTYPEDELEKQMAQNAIEEQKKNTEIVAARKTSAEEWNMEYTFAGNKDLVPVRVFDDGEFTFMQFPEKAGVPAIFEVDNEKKESLINFHVSGKYIVVQRIAKQFILRSGNKATCIFNNAYNTGEPTILKEDGNQPVKSGAPK